MLSTGTTRPVLATHDENTTNHRLTMNGKKTGLQQNVSDVSVVIKTPAAATTRRALGDISNRKVTLAAPTTAVKPTTTMKGAATASKRASSKANLLIQPDPPLVYDEIEVSAGRTWAQQQRNESFDSVTSLDADGSRFHWDSFFQDMERIVSN